MAAYDERIAQLWGTAPASQIGEQIGKSGEYVRVRAQRLNLVVLRSGPRVLQVRVARPRRPGRLRPFKRQAEAFMHWRQREAHWMEERWQ